jgi:hypothetical protein
MTRARITLTTALTGASPLTEEQVVAAIMATKPKRPAFTEAAVRRLFRNCAAINLRGDIWGADAALETGDFTSPLYEQYGNIGGLAAFDDGTYAGGTFRTPEIAADAFVAHAMAYVYGRALAAGAAWVQYDPRWQPAIDRVRRLGTISAVGQLGNGNWATSPKHAPALVERFTSLFGHLTIDQTEIPETGEEPPTVTRPKILLIAGHRSHNDTGNPGEQARTPALALAYYEAFTAAGYEVWWLQRDLDGDGDPDDTIGGLDTVSNFAYQWGARTPGPLVLLDLHYEGAYARGHFAIVPDKTGLGTAVAYPQPEADTWAGNPLDRALGRAWADRMRVHTNLPYRTTGVVEPGLMSETQTGVAGRYRARLATFAYTAPYRDRMVRLVLEHGSLLMEADVQIIDTPGFPDRCALAAVEAVNQVYAISADIPPDEELPDPAPGEKHTLPEGMTPQLARRWFGRYAAPWGVTYAFDIGEAPSQVWLARAKRSIPAGESFEEGQWPTLVEVIRRGNSGDQGEIFRWSNGWAYWRRPKASAQEVR